MLCAPRKLAVLRLSLFCAHLDKPILVGGSVDVLIELETLRCTGRWPAGLKVEVMAWINGYVDDLRKE
jgi:hypothetical protein